MTHALDVGSAALPRPHQAPRFCASWIEELEEDAAAGDIAPDLLRDVILPSQLLASAECLDVYRHMFAVRVEDELERRFPAVRAAVGESLFGELCRDHARRIPGPEPRADVAAGFPAQLASSERLDAARAAWISELASLESAVEGADEADAQPTLSLAELVDLSRDEWQRARFELAPSVRLLALEHQIDGAYDAWLHGDLPATPSRRAQWLVVFRRAGDREGRVERLPVPRRAFAVLGELAAGAPLGSALRTGDHGARRTGGAGSLGTCARAETQRRLFRWLCTWVAAGMFRAIRRS